MKKYRIKKGGWLDRHQDELLLLAVVVFVLCMAVFIRQIPVIAEGLEPFLGIE